jgi:hypothetical protein
MAEVDVVAAAVTGAADNHDTTADDNHNGSSDWAKGLDDGLKKKVEKFKTPSDLAKGYVELEAYSSKAFQDMTDSEKEKYFKRLGLPESPEAYELSGVVLPEGINQDPKADAEFKTVAHALKFTKEQTKSAHEWLMKRAANSIIAQRAAAKKQAEDRESALRTSWGVSFDANDAAAKKAIALGGDAFVQFFNSGPGKDPVIREGFLAISKLMADETLVSGKPPRRETATVRPGMVADFSKSPELAK